MPFIGQIGIFAGPPPPGWLPCDGQILPIVGNELLYSVVGQTYYGDGFNVFGLPDLRGRTPVHGAVGIIQPGQKFGKERVSLSPIHLPPHSHEAGTTNVPASTHNPSGAIVASGPNVFAGDPSPNVTFDLTAVDYAGNGDPHDNIQPYLALNFAICASGGVAPVAGPNPGVSTYTKFGGMIQLVAFANIVPGGYMLPDGTELLRAVHSALFSLMGIAFGGGDGVSTFQVPDMRGLAINCAGMGTGLSSYSVGDKNGEGAHPLITSELPIHRHGMQGAGTASLADPTNAVFGSSTTAPLYAPSSDGSNLNLQAILPVGQGAPHENHQPGLAIVVLQATDDVDPDYVIGEIRIIPTGVIPAKWAACDGANYATAAQPDLFDAIGYTYTLVGGGPNFNVPDLRGRIPVHVGKGDDLDNTYALGDVGGSETVTLTVPQMAMHRHPFSGAAGRSARTNTASAPTNFLTKGVAGIDSYYALPGTPVAMHTDAIRDAGGGAAHGNIMPMIALQYIIALAL